MKTLYPMLFVLLFTIACSDDDSTVADAAVQTADAAAVDASAEADAAAAVDAGAEADAAVEPPRDETFCSNYEATCTFDPADAQRFNDSADCLTQFNGFADSRKSCVETHLGLAGGNPGVHCPHATGFAPCN